MILIITRELIFAYRYIKFRSIPCIISRYNKIYLIKMCKYIIRNKVNSQLQLLLALRDFLFMNKYLNVYLQHVDNAYLYVIRISKHGIELKNDLCKKHQYNIQQIKESYQVYILSRKKNYTHIIEQVSLVQSNSQSYYLLLLEQLQFKKGFCQNFAYCILFSVQS